MSMGIRIIAKDANGLGVPMPFYVWASHWGTNTYKSTVSTNARGFVETEIPIISAVSIYSGGVVGGKVIVSPVSKVIRTAPEYRTSVVVDNLIETYEFLVENQTGQLPVEEPKPEEPHEKLPAKVQKPPELPPAKTDTGIFTDNLLLDLAIIGGGILTIYLLLTQTK